MSYVSAGEVAPIPPELREWRTMKSDRLENALRQTEQTSPEFYRNLVRFLSRTESSGRQYISDLEQLERGEGSNVPKDL